MKSIKASLFTNAFCRTLLGAAFVVAFLFSAKAVLAASLSAGPAGGTFTVGSTFDVKLYLNTEGELVNAVGVLMSFPADRLQLVSAVVSGESIIEVWSAQPKFNNSSGTIELQGGIPGGIRTSSGLITTLRFRVKSVGDALIKFLDTSKVLLHDGRGTDVLRDRANGLYNLTLPPPAGPEVVSETHPESGHWYANQNVVLSWAGDDAVEGYSYILTDDPVDIPDDISEGAKRSVTYRDVSAGVHYFHIKALRSGEWGGTTHFAVKVDGTPPAEFAINVVPSARTVRKQPVIEFVTTDALSGLSHFELKLVPLQLKETAAGAGADTFFIETQSPYVTPELALGTYHVIVRAYDKAGNYREVTQKIAIVSSVFSIIGERGLEVRNTLTIPWPWVWVIGILLVGALAFALWRVQRWHRRVELKRASRDLPGHLQDQLKELKAYRNKYGKLAVLLLMAASLWFGAMAHAQVPELAPPAVTTVSQNISNEEIFYIGGRISTPNGEVQLYLQNLASGETTGETIKASASGEWFYRHHAFLEPGNYRLWAQSRAGEQLSPPSPQVELNVERTAIQLGASRLSYATMYLVSLVVFVVLAITLLVVLIIHLSRGRRKHKQLMKEIMEAEASVRRGFAVLRRDIEAELAVIRRAGLSGELSQEEQKREKQLMEDLANVEKYISKEIWDVEQVEQVEER